MTSEKKEPEKIKPGKIVTLEKWEYEKAAIVGVQRFIARWDSQDAKQYSNKNRQQPNLIANIASCICELAVAKATNRYWHGHVWHTSEHDKYKFLPDVGVNQEVRRCRTPHGVAIQKYQNHMKDLVVFGVRILDEEMRNVEIYGYITQEKGWEIGTFPEWDEGKLETKVVPFNLLTKLK